LSSRSAPPIDSALPAAAAAIGIAFSSAIAAAIVIVIIHRRIGSDLDTEPGGRRAADLGDCDADLSSSDRCAPTR
jgi:hypothetical protein